MSDAMNTQYPRILAEHILEDGTLLLRIGYKISEKTYDPFWVAHIDTHKGVAHMSPIPGDDCSDPKVLRCIAGCFRSAARAIEGAT